jgi:hypothetical protein
MNIRNFVLFVILVSFASCKSSSSPDDKPSSPYVASASSSPNNTVRQAVYVGNTLYIAGDFDSIGGKWITTMAKFDGNSWTNVGSDIPIWHSHEINALVTDGTNLYAGGDILGSINGENITHIARFDGEKLHYVPSFSDNLFHWPKLLTYASGSLYEFDEPYIFGRYNGTAWEDLGNVGPGEDSVTSIVAANGSVYAVVRISYYTPTGVRLWKYTGNSWSTQGSGTIAVNGEPDLRLAAHGTDVYVAGDFGKVGSLTLTSYGVAKWDGTQWSSVGTLSGNAKVTAIAISDDGEIYIAQPGKLLKCNGTTWEVVATTAGGFGNQGIIRTIALSKSGAVAIGGEFTSVSNASGRYLAVLK